jgi:hypothetical protein
MTLTSSWWNVNHISAVNRRWINWNFNSHLHCDIPLIILKTLNLLYNVKLACLPCMLLWLMSFLDVLKPLPHISHLFGLSVMCALICFRRCCLVWNRNLHSRILQTHFSHPLCHRMCAPSWDILSNTFPHPRSWHLYWRLSSGFCTQQNFHTRGKA